MNAAIKDYGHIEAAKLSVAEITSDEYKKYIKAVYSFGNYLNNSYTSVDDDVELLLLIEHDTPREVIDEIISVSGYMPFYLPDINISFSKSDDFEIYDSYERRNRERPVLIWKRN